MGRKGRRASIANVDDFKIPDLGDKKFSKKRRQSVAMVNISQISRRSSITSQSSESSQLSPGLPDSSLSSPTLSVFEDSAISLSSEDIIDTQDGSPDSAPTNIQPERRLSQVDTIPEDDEVDNFEIITQEEKQDDDSELPERGDPMVPDRRASLAETVPSAGSMGDGIAEIAKKMRGKGRRFSVAVTAQAAFEKFTMKRRSTLARIEMLQKELLQSKKWDRRMVRERKSSFKTTRHKIEYVQEQVEEEDPEVTYRNIIFEIVKNGLSLACVDDEIKVSVDNIFPIVKTLGLDPKDETLLDMVRTACIETFGDIDPKEFDNVICSMVDEKVEKIRQEEAEQMQEEEAQKPKKSEKEKPVKTATTEESENGEEKSEEEEKEEEEEEVKKEPYDEIKAAFNFVDHDHDGFITVPDLYALMMGLGEMLTDDELVKMFKEVDLDKDGKITLKDFQNFLVPERMAQQAAEAQANQQAEGEKQVEGEQMDEEAPKLEERRQSEMSSDDLLSEEEKRALREKRKKSLLWGYKAVAEQEEEKKKEEEKIKEEEKRKEEEKKAKKEAEKAENDEAETKSKVAALPREMLVRQDTQSVLGAIREEEEGHSETEGEHKHALQQNANEQRGFSVDSKKQRLSRQSSGASIKTRQGSSDGPWEDSGIETVDGEEIPDQELSDDEGDATGERSPMLSARKRSGRSRRSDGDSLEDDVESGRDTSSRVSSARSSRARKGRSDDEGILNEHSGLSDLEDEDYTRTFVEQYMYYEVGTKDSEESEEEADNKENETWVDVVEDAAYIEQRLDRARLLQKAILRRSNTEPVFSICRQKSKTQRDYLEPKTSSVNPQCRHIDISLDLTGDSPPKAVLKSYRDFENRAKSALSRTQSSQMLQRKTDKHISVVNVSDSVCEEIYVDRKEYPKRPPSPKRRPMSALPRMTRNSQNSNQLHLQGDFKSAIPQVPMMRKKLDRPKTADIPYTRSERVKPKLNIYKTDNFSVINLEEILDTDTAYPRKSLLTSNHHGFKTIWPIGRKLHIIKKKRPFTSLQLTSISRSIERDEYPFTCQSPKSSSKRKRISSKSEKPSTGDGGSGSGVSSSVGKSIIRLDLPVNQVSKPKWRSPLTGIDFAPFR